LPVAVPQPGQNFMSGAASSVPHFGQKLFIGMPGKSIL
jgi:hypothetical protein